MSSDKVREKRTRRKSEVSYARLILVGLVGPKPRPKGVGDGQLVYIPVPPMVVMSEGVTQEGRLGAALEMLSSKLVGVSQEANPLWR
jgi:hypothetical protein